MPSIEGELTLGFHHQLASDPEEVQLPQMPKLGGSRAYPVHPLLFCRLENVFPPPLEPLTATVSWAVADQPQLSHSWTTG